MARAGETYLPNSESKISSFLSANRLESDTSGFNKGSWSLDFDYLVNNKPVNVKKVLEFESAYAAGTACLNTANALTDALTENFKILYKMLAR